MFEVKNARKSQATNCEELIFYQQVFQTLTLRLTSGNINCRCFTYSVYSVYCLFIPCLQNVDHADHYDVSNYITLLYFSSWYVLRLCVLQISWPIFLVVSFIHYVFCIHAIDYVIMHRIKSIKLYCIKCMEKHAYNRHFKYLAHLRHNLVIFV